MTDNTVPPELQAAFDAAVAQAKTLPTRPDNLTLLQLYGLYKQACDGDVVEQRPGMGDIVARAKWDAWARHQGMSRAAAMQAYIDQIHALSSHRDG